MGILNLTPDSFFEGSRVKDEESLLEKVGEMLSDGADILDIGGYSSRPGATDIPVAEELKRVIPAIESIRSNFPGTIISVDTFRGKVAMKAIQAGASIINDISGYSLDPEMPGVVKELNVPYILMHMQGTPQNMHTLGNYTHVTSDLIRWFSEKTEELRSNGVNDIIIDPGLGFGKKAEHSFQLLRELDRFKIFGLPVLAGLSRKSFIYKTLGTTAENALNGTTALHMTALMKGAKILRVHDVKEAKEVVELYCLLLKEPGNTKDHGEEEFKN